MNYTNVPTTPERRMFSKLARQYVSAMDLFSIAITNAEAGGVGDAQAQAAKLHANAQRSLSYKALLQAAVQLAEAGAA